MTSVITQAVVLAGWLVVGAARVGADVDLSVTKTSDSSTASVGTNLTFTMVVTNLGNSAASLVTLTDPLGSNVTFVSATPSQGSCAFTNGAVVCDLGSLSTTDSVDVALVVVPTATGDLSNTVTVAAAETDTNPSDNVALAVVAVGPGPTNLNLHVSHSVRPAPVQVNQPLTYTVRVRNDGPTDATGVTLTDTLPDSVTFVSANSDQGTCDVTGNTVTCNLDSLTNGTIDQVQIVVTPGQAGVITNAAIVTADQPVATGRDNPAAVVVRVVVPSGDTNLSLSCSSVTQTCKATKQGKQCTLAAVVNVTNNGSSKSSPQALVQFFLSSDETLSADDVPLLKKPIALSTVPAGQTKTRRVHLKSTTSATGQFVITVITFNGQTLSSVACPVG